MIKKFYSDQSTNQSQDESQIDNPSESDMDNKNSLSISFDHTLQFFLFFLATHQ